jgi:hypothetical protein
MRGFLSSLPQGNDILPNLVRLLNRFHPTDETFGHIFELIAAENSQAGGRRDLIEADGAVCQTKSHIA